jgi:hypothetical protein
MPTHGILGSEADRHNAASTHLFTIAPPVPTACSTLYIMLSSFAMMM